MAQKETKTTSSTAKTEGGAAQGENTINTTTNPQAGITAFAAGGEGEGTNTTTSTSGIGTDVTAGNLGAADTGNVQAAAATAKQTKESAGYPVKIVKPNHTHNGQEVKKGTTILVDMATYRWLLETKVGEPGNKDDVGLDVTAKGEAIKPETDEEAIARLEAEFAAKKEAE